MVTAPTAPADLDLDGRAVDPPRRRVGRPPGLPRGRAVVGGLLVALAGVGTLVTWQRAAGTPDRSYAVADRAITPGDVIGADDVRLVAIDLPAGVRAAAFTHGDALAGRVALAPISPGELIQASQVSEPGEARRAAEVSLSLERDRAVDGRLRSGDLVDVFATVGERTAAIAAGLQVVDVTAGGGPSFSSGSPVTVTLAVSDAGQQLDIVHAARVGEVTLVRSTGLGGGGSRRADGGVGTGGVGTGGVGTGAGGSVPTGGAVDSAGGRS